MQVKVFLVVFILNDIVVFLFPDFLIFLIRVIGYPTCLPPSLPFFLSVSLSLSLSLPGGLTQRADVGAEARHSAASVSQHSGGLREQLAGKKYFNYTSTLYCNTERNKCHITSSEFNSSCHAFNFQYKHTCVHAAVCLRPSDTD